MDEGNQENKRIPKLNLDSIDLLCRDERFVNGRLVSTNIEDSIDHLLCKDKRFVDGRLVNINIQGEPEPKAKGEAGEDEPVFKGETGGGALTIKGDREPKEEIGGGELDDYGIGLSEVYKKKN
ncbi:hypothetical protein C5167_002001 [Papaver somniferum]|uniref:Uncharacterized protein n=1 Tax=Papaver somniferum TaxID=3469 RepID=A0A4Y7L0V4_PAPSO|nr:uncharacterized protein LOC113310100 [Papaver somniferum]RZC77825.1 hypothetical protein C5167_002001 [Papaver somniferum]